jgi:two-component system LytT family sensor kinase
MRRFTSATAPTAPRSSTARAGLAWLVAWCVFFGALGLMSRAIPMAQRSSVGALIGSEIGAAITWAVLSLAIARYHERVRRATTNLLAVAAAHVPGLFIAAAADVLSSRATSLLFEPASTPVPFLALLVFYLDFDIVAYLVVVAVTEVVQLRRALAERQRQAEQLERSLARARLDYLAAQLQPHFLFNSLGAVSELAYHMPAAAARVLRQLASIFRTALATRDDEITLGEEIVGIEPYLDIQRIRFADWLRIDYRVDDGAVDCLVPRFVLQPLVENAIRHGLSGRHAAGTIEISASADDGMLVVRVADDGIGLEAAAANTGRGIGLANVRDRLRILYGDSHELRLASGDGGGAIAELRIPARRRGGVVSSAVDPRTSDDTAREMPGIVVPQALRNPVIAHLVLWTIGGLLWTQQSFTYLQLRGRLGASTWQSIARNDMPLAGVWAVLAPCVLYLARRFPLQRYGWAWRSLLYVAGGVVVDAGQVLLWRLFAERRQPVLSVAYEMTLIVGFLIYLVLVAFAHRTVVLEWLRARDESAAVLRAELDEAQARAMKLQAIPPVLLESLDGIAQTAQRDPGLTERQLTRLADYLRLALECTDAHGITAERQRALDGAVAELREMLAAPPDLDAVSA